MNVTETPLEGVKIIEPDRFEDERGWFMEVWNEERYRVVGLGDARLVQTNVSRSQRGVLRGMHYQWPQPQAKLVSVLEGVVFDVVVDIRRGSATFAQWYGCELSRDNRRQLWVPEGFAHGFLVRSEHAIVHYSCTMTFVQDADRVLAWDDPDIGIGWPSAPLTISSKDAAASRLGEISLHELPPCRSKVEPPRR